MEQLPTLVLSVLLLITALPGFASEDADMLEKASEYLAGGDYQRAVASYQLARKLDPDDTDIVLSEASVHLLLEDYAAATELIESALDINPISPDAWYMKCLTDALSGNMAAFEEDSVFASVCGVELSSDPASLGILCADAGFFAKAAEFFAQADFETLTVAQRRLYKKSLTQSGQEPLIETLGLGAAPARNEQLDAAFVQDTLSLLPVEFPKPSAADFEFPDELWDAVKKAGGQPTEDVDAALEAALEDADIALYSLSPSGNSGLLQINDGIWLGMYKDKYRMIYPLGTRGAADENGDLIKLLGTPLKNLLADGNVVYSPDGRYASVYNYRFSLRMMNSMMDPVIIDLSTGEAFLAASHGNKATEDNFGLMTAARFSADGQYLYYMLFGSTADRNTSLWRYDLTADKAELCFSGYDDTYFPLAETADGELFTLREPGGYSDMPVIVVIAEENGQWTSREYAGSVTAALWRPRSLVYTANSDCVLAAGQSILNRNVLTLLQLLRPDEDCSGIGRYIAISKEDNSPILLTDEDLASVADSMDPEQTSALSFLSILNAGLSPDGNYALIMTNDMESHSTSLYLLRLEDMEMKEVHLPEDMALPLAPSMLRIEWNTDTLLIGTINGPTAFRFE